MCKAKHYSHKGPLRGRISRCFALRPGALNYLLPFTTIALPFQAKFRTSLLMLCFRLHKGCSYDKTTQAQPGRGIFSPLKGHFNQHRQRNLICFKIFQASQAGEFDLLHGYFWRLYHQTLSNDMPFASLPCKPVLFVITKFVALLYDFDKCNAKKSPQQANSDFKITFLQVCGLSCSPSF